MRKASPLARHAAARIYHPNSRVVDCKLECIVNIVDEARTKSQVPLPHRPKCSNRQYFTPRGDAGWHLQPPPRDDTGDMRPVPNLVVGVRICIEKITNKIVVA